jgi:hypothetical protein
MKKKPYTKDDFIHNHEQRAIDKGHVLKLIASMRKHGFRPSKPIQCYRKGNKLVIVDGHHRLEAAFTLGIEPHVVIEDESCQDTMTDVNAVVKRWIGDDYVRLWAHRGNENFLKLIEYKEKYNIPYGMASSMMINNAAASGNTQSSLKDGTFKIKSMLIIDDVASIIEEFRKFSNVVTTRTFIAAISRCIMCDEFSSQVFRARLRENIGMLQKTSNVDQMITSIEAIYNHRSRNPIPIKFLVDKAAKERNATGWHK